MEFRPNRPHRGADDSYRDVGGGSFSFLSPPIHTRRSDGTTCGGGPGRRARLPGQRVRGRMDALGGHCRNHRRRAGRQSVRDPGAPWLDFLAQFGGVLLTLLAGAEVDPGLLKSKLRPSLVLGGASFLLPFLASTAFALYVAHWTTKASLIAGVALSTTSLAVVYAVLVETGLNATEVGKLLMAATFVTDIGTALALSLLFVQFSWTTAVFFAASAVIIVLAPRVLPPVFERYGARVIEPEIKLLFAILFGFMLLASLGKSHAVLPVFVLGLVLGPMFHRHRELQRKLRIVAFGAITPFFFLKGGMSVSLRALGPH